MPQRGESVWISTRTHDFPFDETALGAAVAAVSGTVWRAASHGGFVSRDDFMGEAALADEASVDTDNAAAEAANLIELMGDEDDDAAGAGEVGG